MSDIRDTQDIQHTDDRGRPDADRRPGNAEQWDAIVIGGGAAGLSAALMLGRARRRVLVVDSGEPRNRFAAHMHGVLGDDGTAPAELLRRGREELREYDVTVRPGTVTAVDDHHELNHDENSDDDNDDERAGLTVRFADAAPASTRVLILATGMTDGLPDIPGLARFWGTDVLHCTYCHGWEVRGRRLAVLGTSEMSAHQAQLVRQWSDDLVFLTAELGELDPEVEARLRARGVQIVDTPVAEILSEDGRLSGVRLTDGREIGLDAVFVASAARPHDDLVAHLELERTSNPMGSFLATDMTGKTSHPRIWAVGNVSNPGATVPVSMSAGSMAAGMANMDLITEEFDRAVSDAPATPAEYWEGEYSGSGARWSGDVNATTAAVVRSLTAGDVLELGCGEGGDAVWLAEQGWRVTAVDISPTATARGAEAAAARGVAERIDWVAHDLSTWTTEEQFDLVTASFFHSEVELPRTEILRRAADRLRPGGHLLLVSHVFETEADIPPWARRPTQGRGECESHSHGHGTGQGHGHGEGDGHGHGKGHGTAQGDGEGHSQGHGHSGGHGHDLPTPAQVRAELALDPALWEVVLEETRPREMVSPDGDQTATVRDGVLLVRRRP